jgi:hypothetical protein
MNFSPVVQRFRKGCAALFHGYSRNHDMCCQHAAQAANGKAVFAMAETSM